MLAQDKLAHKAPQKNSPIARINLGSTTDSIFIIQSLLAAIIKDCAPISVEANVVMAKLKQEIIFLENKNSISDAEFFSINNQFYLALPQVKKFQGLTKIILKEKLRVDRIIRLALSQQESYKPILGVYKNILEGIQSNHMRIALNAVSEFADVMKDYAYKVEKTYPDTLQKHVREHV